MKKIEWWTKELQVKDEGKKYGKDIGHNKRLRPQNRWKLKKQGNNQE